MRNLTLGRVVTVLYKNYRGELGVRKITPLRYWTGHTLYHPRANSELLLVYDHEKKANRDYSVNDILGIFPNPSE
jgi:hypothetical protein